MKRSRQSVLNPWAVLAILIAVSACGGGGGSESPPGPITVSTLAYVVSECNQEGAQGTIRQRLEIRRGEQAPITVADTSAVGFTAAVGFCAFVPGFNRQGPAFADLGVFHRLGVTADGSQVVFEVTDEAGSAFFPFVFPANTLPEEQKGIFVVGADGAGLRRLGPASRVAPFYTAFFEFSPSGRTAAYTDHDLTGAVQIFTLDLGTGDRRQVTQLPPASGLFGGTYTPFFNDDQTITFFTIANADGHHPDGSNIVVTVKTDGTGLTVAPAAVAIPGSEVLTSFRITGSELSAAVLTLPGTPVNPGVSGNGGIQEVFVADADKNVLQLTNFDRVDTFNAKVSADGQRVFFSASANPPELGDSNPSENCQIFSIDRAGGDLRQLTDFREAPEGQLATNGCSFGPRPFGCGSFFTGREIHSEAVLFYSTCDPLGTNPNGSQLFAMHPDGTGLRQLTNTRGYSITPHGVVSVELPFPFAYPGFELRNQISN